MSSLLGRGLPLAKALAEMYGAAFVVRSELGVGTTIPIVFPQQANGRVAVSKLEPNPERLLALLHRWQDEAVRTGRTITRIALAFAGPPRGSRRAL